jgi:hypothetical protein
MFKAVVEQFAARADANGQIAIDFSPSASSPDQNAKVDGIEVIPVTFGSRILTQSASITALQGQPFSGTLATFVDTDPGGLAGDYIATIDWGDGGVTTGTIQPDPSGSGFDIVGSHTYTGHGQLNVAITIQTYDGAAVRMYVPASVTGALQSIGLPTTYTATAGSPTGPIVLSTFTDATPGANVGDYTSSIVWGDGVTDSGTVVKALGDFLVVASHTYGQSGTYVPVVTITASDGAGLTTNNATVVVNAAPVAPAITLASSGGRTALPNGNPSSVPISQHAIALGTHHARKSLFEHTARSKVDHTSRSKGKHRAAHRVKATLVVAVGERRPGHSISLDLEELARHLLS